MAKKPVTKLTVETLKHDEATRKNIPTAEYQSVMQNEDQSPVRISYERRNRDLDPQLVWRGKDEQDWSDLVVNAQPLYIQEKVHPKVLIDDLKRQSEQVAAGKAANQSGFTTDMFGDFDGYPKDVDKTDFYQHDGKWQNRMILGDSLQVMASLAEREGLRGKVQCIYFDPPYGIKFNSNFQWSTTSRDVKDGNTDHITREPEQVKAFRDTWRDGIHSYLTYLRDRLTVARDLLTDSGSIFVQIGDENVHRVRAVLDDVFGDDNFMSQITIQKTGGLSGKHLKGVSDFILWFAKDSNQVKYRQLLSIKKAGVGDNPGKRYDQLELTNGERRALSKEQKADASDIPVGSKIYQLTDLTSISSDDKTSDEYKFQGKVYYPPSNRHWSTKLIGRNRLEICRRIVSTGKRLMFVRYLNDFPAFEISNIWDEFAVTPDVKYVVQTHPGIISRCILMTTDPGDLALDPTCGSGTTAYVAEQWGRRWITIDTSRVALALARARIMGARYPYYLLSDSRDGQIKEAEVTRTVPSIRHTHGNIRQGFVYERVPHITLKSIANNAEIDVIWEKFQQKLEPLRIQLNKAIGKEWQEWEIPRSMDSNWLDATKKLHAEWWQSRINRQKEIDASIAAKAEYEYLYDKPYEDKKKVRVAGPFTVESLSPHRVLAVDENDELIDRVAQTEPGYGEERDFVQIILENLKTAGVQQAHKEDKVSFTALTPWPGDLICGEGRYEDAGGEKRAAIFIGPEFGTVSRPDLVSAAREAGDAGFDVLIACAFNYDAHSCDFDKLGRIPVLKARMNADLHMADDLKNTGKGNLFVIFGEPDIDILEAEAGQVRVKVKGVDVFHPNTGEVRSDGAEGIACWFIDTDYNMEAFFVRHAYFLGANDPYKSLKTTLKAEINIEAWASLNSDTSRPFDKPKSGRIAVKVINHLGDEVMKVFRVN
jgi:adenine-specific DNA-methyltransferase